MKTTKKSTIKIAGRDTNIKAVTAEWLTSRARNGRQRVECLGWKRLAAIYAANEHNSPICAIIRAEAWRCGYDPKTILALNAE